MHIKHACCYAPCTSATQPLLPVPGRQSHCKGSVQHKSLALLARTRELVRLGCCRLLAEQHLLLQLCQQLLRTGLEAQQILDQGVDILQKIGLLSGAH